MKILLFTLLCSSTLGHDKPGTDVLKKMYNHYHGKWQTSFTFHQTTENYRNDSLIRTATWHEAIVYPDKFRIDFGDIKKGNAVIFSRDSSYNFRNGKLARVGVNDNELTFLLGGMYFYPFDTVVSRVTALGYDTKKLHESKWQNKAAYVIGSTNDSAKVNQLWIDKKNLYVLRFIKYDKGHKEEGILSDHKKFGGRWSETAFSFFIDDKLIQKEKYFDCKANEKIDDAVFDPKLFGSVHWY